MIAVDNILVSDEVIQEYFICNLSKCKGACCVEGDSGAPLTENETIILAQIYPDIKSSLCPEFIHEIEKQGTHVLDIKYKYVTPIINGGICAYGYFDEEGIVKCGIEKAWLEGKTDFRKPISCHLFPIRILETDNYEAVNYEPRKDICSPACKLGKKQKLPVYKFLKDGLTRKYGKDFFEMLENAEKLYLSKIE